MTKKRFDTAIRQDQIAEAALDIVRSGGLKALSVAAVAEKVGIVPSAVYRHYGNKSQIIDAVLHLTRKRLSAHYQNVVQLDADPLEKLHRLLTQHVEMIGSNNAIPQIIFSGAVAGGQADKRRLLYTIIDDVLQNVSAVVIEGQRSGQIRDDLPPLNVAVAFLGMIQPAAIIWNLSAGEFDLVRHSEHAWRLFLDAIRVAP